MPVASLRQNESGILQRSSPGPMVAMTHTLRLESGLTTARGKPGALVHRRVRMSERDVQTPTPEIGSESAAEAEASPALSAVYVRDMEIDDLAPVFHLGEELFTSDRYPFLYRTWDEFEVIGLYNTDEDYCMVAEDEETGALAGFVLGTVIFKGSWTYGYIIWLGVSPRYQKRGVGDKLVDRLVERMIEDGVRLMLVDTDPRNIPAVKFFKRKGFGSKRDHIVLSMNLEKHDKYGRLIERERERERQEKEERKLNRARAAAVRKAREAAVAGTPEEPPQGSEAPGMASSSSVPSAPVEPLLPAASRNSPGRKAVQRGKPAPVEPASSKKGGGRRGAT